VEDEASLDEEIDAFLKLMSHDHHKEAFLSDVMRSQMHAAVHKAFQAGWLQLVFLEIGGQKAAAYLNFDFDNRIWLYNSGINFDFNYYSPGWVLLAYIIQWGIENGREALDFMRGDEDYKYRFGGVDRYVLRVQIER
jgi:CelD/BcsL family acetyltransferase involved in cellulose biosynthesis